MFISLGKVKEGRLFRSEMMNADLYHVESDCLRYSGNISGRLRNIQKWPKQSIL